MNNINSKLIILSVISGLVLPLVFGGLLAISGLAPAFGFMPEGSGLLSLFSSGAGWGVYLLAAALFTAAGLIPALAGDNEYAEEEEEDEADSREEGEVKWFNPNKGYGFITRANGDEIFAHFRSIRGRGHRTLRQGQKVRFRAVEGEKGMQAEDISPIKSKG